MKRIYEVMKAMDTDPASFFKQVARGEIALIIESVTGEQLKPSLEFWKQVNRDNSYPTHKVHKAIGLNRHFSDSDLTITPNTLKLLEGCDGFNQSTKLDFFKHITPTYNSYSPEHYSLHLSNIYTDYQPAQANNAPADSVKADQPKTQTIQAKGGYAAKINQAIIDFEQSAEFIKHGKGTQQGLVGDWLESRGFAHRDEQRVIKVLISEHYGLTTSRKSK